MNDQRIPGYDERDLDTYLADGFLEEDAAYEAHMAAELARHEAECGCPWTGGPAHDPYGTSCDLDKGHDGDHSGPNPFGGDDPLTWSRIRGRRETLRRYE